MRRNCYVPATHIGIQPVRVLKWNIAYALENVHPAFPKEFHGVLKKHGLKPCIAYDFSERGIADPRYSDQLIPHVDQDKQITIQETFLSLLWAMCYSHLVMIEQLNSKRILNQVRGHGHAIDERTVQRAANLYEYGVSLVRSYTPWDKTRLPNPEEYDDADIYIEKTNAAFVFAIVFILCHEFAHIERGHLDDYIPTVDQPLAEAEADRQAVETMLKGGGNPSEKLTYKVGMLLGFCSLLTLRRTLESESHPHLAHRIEGVLRAQNLADDSPLWGHATLSFKLWDHLHNRTKPRIQWPRSASHFKALFYHVLEQVE